MLRFGTGGIPLTVKDRNAIAGIRRIRELGLAAMELEFVYQIFLDKEKAEEVRKVAEELDVALSVHGSYYVNLGSEDKQKWHASITRVVQAAKIGELAGARYVTFHAGFRQKQDGDLTYKNVKDGISRILDEVDKAKLKIKITPELTGKASQWGDLEELIKLNKDLGHNNLGFCFDFAHKHARDGGGFNSKKEFDNMLILIKKELGEKFHISGINYTEKGERNHLTLLGGYKEYEHQGIDIEGMEKYYEDMQKKNKIGPADLEWKGLLQSLKEFGVGGTVVCESPNLEQDAILMSKTYEKL